MPAYAKVTGTSFSPIVEPATAINETPVGWDQATISIVIDDAEWEQELDADNKGIGDTPTGINMPSGSDMRVVARAPRMISPNVWRVRLSLRGHLRALVSGEYKRVRENIDGAVESATITPAASSLVKSTGTIWAYDGTDWYDTEQTGTPSVGLPSVASPAGLSSTIVVTAGQLFGSAKPGKQIRFFSPRVTLADTYIAGGAHIAADLDTMLEQLGRGAGGTGPQDTGVQIGGVEDLPPGLPDIAGYTAPASMSALNVPWGWVLVGRNAEPVTPQATDLWLIEDTLVYFQDFELI